MEDYAALTYRFYTAAAIAVLVCVIGVVLVFAA